MEIEGGWNRGSMAGDQVAVSSRGAVLIEGRFHCEADMCKEWPDKCIN
jgi:hypothetical protein